MNGTTRDTGTRSVADDGVGAAGKGPPHRLRLLVNWISALLTVPVAVIVLIFGLGAVMSTSGCSNPRCEGPSGVVFTVLFYAAPIIAAVTIVASFFTARRGWGTAVPICGLVLLAADAAVLALSFRT